MKKYDYIGIKSCYVNGVKNPAITVFGTIKLENYNFVVEVDGKNVDLEYLSVPDQSEFCISAVLPKKSKNIKIYLINNDSNKKDLVYEGKTSFLKRLTKKIFRYGFNIIKKAGHFFRVFYRGIRFMWKEYHLLVPISLWPKYFNDLKRSLKNGSVQFYNPLNKSDYKNWLSQNTNDVIVKPLKYNPLISIITPVYNVDGRLLEECIKSVLDQTYDNFELCLVDDCSTKSETLSILKKYENFDERIKVVYRKENGNISNASNDGLKMSSGEFIALLDNDDVLDSNALYEMVLALNENKKLDLLYSDEDKLDLRGKRCDPHFKPDFSPDTLLSLNYICHFTVIRKKVVESVSGFEVGLDGAQDYDLFLKVTEKTKLIKHIPKILYHWRMLETSTSMSGDNKNYAQNKGKIAIENALKRRKISGTVSIDKKSGYYIVNYDVKKEPMISIVIPTRDYVDVLKTCVDSIYEKTTYKNFEVIIANNDSKEEATLKYFKECKKKYKNFKVVDCIMNFNYSKINNTAIKCAKGDYIVLLNNDTEIITPDWLKIMVGYAMQKHIGVVGAKLYYPDGTIQHAGVLLGLGGVASHAYVNSRKEENGLYGRLRVPYNYSACTAACIMIKKSIYDKVKGLNEELEVAYNDVDFCIRILNEKLYNVFLPQVELTHFESKSRGLDTTTEKYKRFLIESKYMYDNWSNIINNDPFYNPNFSKSGWFMLDKKGKK